MIKTVFLSSDYPSDETIDNQINSWLTENPDIKLIDIKFQSNVSAVADNVYFVNVSTWRKYWRFSYKDRSKKSMKLQAVAKVSDKFNLNVKDDEADAILIGSYFVSRGHEFGDLESHKIS